MRRWQFWIRTRSWWIGAGFILTGLACFSWGIKTMWSGGWNAKEVFPAGTALTVRLLRPLTSQTAALGEVVEGIIVSSAVLKGEGAIPPGTPVELRCVAARKGEGETRPGYLRLALSGLRDARGHLLPLEATTFSLSAARGYGLGFDFWDSLSGENSAPQAASHSSVGSGSNTGEVVVKPESSLTFVLLKPAVMAGER